MPFIQFKASSLTYRLRRSQRAKRLQMSFRANIFEVVAPRRIKNADVLQFIREHQGWMLKQISHPRFIASQISFWPSHFLATEQIYFREKPLLLNVKFGKYRAISFEESSLKITVPFKIIPEGLSHYIKLQVIGWYKQEALQAVEQALQYFCPQLGRWPSAVQIKQQRTRWGSCTAKDKININWLLVAAPQGVLEYVVVHELCHLFHRNHGMRFWAKVAKYFPDYERMESWLSKHGQSLFLN